MPRDAALVPQPQAAAWVPPGDGPLDLPTVPPPPFARLDALAGDPRRTAAPTQRRPGAAVIIGFVRVPLLGAPARATQGPADRTNRLDHRLQHRAVVDVRGRHLRDPGTALPFGQDVVLAAGLGAIRGVRPGRGAPLFAGTRAESSRARSQSRRSCVPRRSRQCWGRCSPTPARCQSRSRRPQVRPLPPPIAWGRYSQGRPVLSTKSIPLRAARSRMRGRPALGLGGSGGRNGAISCQSRSERSGFATPVLYPNDHPACSALLGAAKPTQECPRVAMEPGDTLASAKLQRGAGRPWDGPPGGAR